MRRQLIETNIALATDARHRRATTSVARAWTAQTLAAFLAVAHRLRLYPALHLTAFTGMRRGEVAGLKWSDLDRTHNRLSITRTIQNVAGKPVEFDVKTRTSRRCLDLDVRTVDVLANWRRRLYRDGLRHGPDDWMFLNTAGRFINPESLSQLFARTLRRTPSVPHIRFHDLRHTHASLLVMAGVPIKVVSDPSGCGVLAEVDRHPSLLILEHGDQLQPSAEGLEVLTERRDPDVVGVLELGHRALGHIEPPGQLDLADRSGMAKLVQTDLLESRYPLSREPFLGTGSRNDLGAEVRELGSCHQISPSILSSSR